MASYLRKYATGSGSDIYINIPKAGSANHAVNADWTPAAGDVKVSIDGGAAANIGTLPTAVAMGNSAIWKFVFTNGELTGKFINVTVSDSATKVVDDTGFSIETFGNASALLPFDLGTASTAQTGDNFARLGAPAGASVSADVAAVKVDTAAILVDTGTTLDGRIPAALTADGNMKADTLRVGGTLQTAGDLAAMVATVDDFLDTEIAAILAAVDTEVAAILAAVDTEVAAIKAKTDSLTFTVANELDVNVQSLNGTTLLGNGAGTPWGP